MRNNRQPDPPTRTVESFIADGEVGALLGDMRARPHLYDVTTAMAALRRTMAASAERDFGGFVDDVYKLMIQFTADLLVIAQVPTAKRLDQIEQDIPRHANTFVRQSVEEMLPTVERLHRHVMELTRAYGTTRHTLGIGGPKRKASGTAVMRLATETSDLEEEVRSNRLQGAANG